MKQKQLHMKTNTGQVEPELGGQVDAELPGQVEADSPGQVKRKGVVNAMRKKVVNSNGFSTDTQTVIIAINTRQNNKKIEIFVEYGL